MKNKYFGVLQRMGRSFMLPLAVLPVAGLLLGLGSSFTNETMIEAYGLNSVLGKGTVLYGLLIVRQERSCLTIFRLFSQWELPLVWRNMKKKWQRWRR